MRREWIAFGWCAVLTVNIVVGMYQSTKTNNAAMGVIEMQTEVLQKVAANQKIISERFGFHLGFALEETVKKVDLDSAGN